MIPPIVHLESKAPVTRALDVRRGRLLNEAGAVRVTATSGDDRCRQMHAVVDWLDVERSLRYRRTQSSTWCNIYTTDYCHLAGVYLPHTFWLPSACKAFVRGETPVVKYASERDGGTVNELSANALYNWLLQWGSAYGWTQHTPDAAQALVNAGSIGVICALKTGGIGHVSVIVPESSEFSSAAALRALRDDNGQVIAPLQSQAGATNRKYFATKWWAGRGYAGGIWTVSLSSLSAAQNTHMAL